MARPGFGWWLAGLAGIVAFWLVRAWNPVDSGFQVCVFRGVLGLPCPGCGLTRAAGHLARGSFAAAFTLHPLALPFAVEAVLGWLGWGLVGGDRFRRFVSENAGALTLANTVPLFALWLGRAATGALPF